MEMHEGHHDCVKDGECYSWYQAFLFMWEEIFTPADEAYIEMAVRKP